MVLSRPNPSSRTDVLDAIATAVLVVVLFPTLQGWGSVAWLFTDDLLGVHKWLVSVWYGAWLLPFAILSTSVALWVSRHSRCSNVFVAILPLFALYIVWASPPWSTSWPWDVPVRAGVGAYAALILSQVAILWLRSKTQRAPHPEDASDPLPSKGSKHIFRQTALALINLCGIALGYHAIHQLKLSEFPPFLHGLYDIMMLTIPPPARLIFFWDSSLGRLLIAWMALLNFAFINPRWLGPSLKSIARPLLVLSSASCGLFGLWIWTHTYIEVIIFRG